MGSAAVAASVAGVEDDRDPLQVPAARLVGVPGDLRLALLPVLASGVLAGQKLRQQVLHRDLHGVARRDVGHVADAAAGGNRPGEIVHLLAVDPAGEAHHHRVEGLAALEPVTRKRPGVVGAVHQLARRVGRLPRRRCCALWRDRLRLGRYLGEIVAVHFAVRRRGRPALRPRPGPRQLLERRQEELAGDDDLHAWSRDETGKRVPVGEDAEVFSATGQPEGQVPETLLGGRLSPGACAVDPVAVPRSVFGEEIMDRPHLVRLVQGSIR